MRCRRGCYDLCVAPLFYCAPAQPLITACMSDPVQNAGHTAALAERICGVTFDNLGGDAITVTRRLIADGIAVAMAGTREPAPTIAAGHVRAMSCRDDASAW